jgi:hypothetical protein
MALDHNGTYLTENDVVMYINPKSGSEQECTITRVLTENRIVIIAEDGSLLTVNAKDCYQIP